MKYFLPSIFITTAAVVFPSVVLWKMLRRTCLSGDGVIKIYTHPRQDSMWTPTNTQCLFFLMFLWHVSWSASHTLRILHNSRRAIEIFSSFFHNEAVWMNITLLHQHYQTTETFLMSVATGTCDTCAVTAHLCFHGSCYCGDRTAVWTAPSAGITQRQHLQ